MVDKSHRTKPKPCPGCGGPAEVVERGGGWTVGCMNDLAATVLAGDVKPCPLNAPCTALFPTAEEAIAAWNTRPKEEKLSKERDFFERSLSQCLKADKDAEYERMRGAMEDARSRMLERLKAVARSLAPFIRHYRTPESEQQAVFVGDDADLRLLRTSSVIAAWDQLEPGDLDVGGCEHRRRVQDW